MSVILQYQKQFKLKKNTKSKKYLGTTMSIILQYQKIQKYKKYLKILSPTEKQLKHSQFRKKKTQNPNYTWDSQSL